MNILNSSVYSKKNQETKLYAILKGQWHGEYENFTLNIVLKFESGKWLVEHMDNLVL